MVSRGEWAVVKVRRIHGDEPWLHSAPGDIDWGVFFDDMVAICERQEVDFGFQLGTHPRSQVGERDLKPWHKEVECPPVEIVDGDLHHVPLLAAMTQGGEISRFSADNSI
jgi:hypothetical protein